MKRWIVSLLALTCAGCAPVAKVNLPPDAAKSTVLPVSDVRPADEKDRKFFSLLITSKEYGVIRVGEAHISPSPVDVLRYTAFQKFGAHHTITVYHFVIYLNARSRLRTEAVFGAMGGVAGGAVGGAVSGAIVGAVAGANSVSSSQTKIIDRDRFDNLSGDEEYARAHYSYDEDPNNAPLYIVYLDTDIDGKRVLTRTVAPMQQVADPKALAAAVQLAVNDHLSDYGSSLVAATTPAAAPAMPVPAVAMRPAATAIAAPAAASVAPATPAAPAAMAETLPPSPAPSPAPSPSPQPSATDAAMAANAQDVANQLGCGAIQTNGPSGYIAPCGDHGIYIGCDDNACRPMHTVRMKANE